MSMRVIHLSCISPPDVGGIGQVAATEVAGLCERGIDAHLVSLTSHPSTRIGNAGCIHGLGHFVKECDVVHLHYPFFGTAEHIARMRKRGDIKRLVVTFHMDAIAKGWKGLVFDVYRRYFQNMVFEAADVILVSSKDYALSSSAAKWITKMVEIPFGIDEYTFCPIENKENTQVNQILFVGGMDKAHAFKGVDLLLSAMRELTDASLVLVGDGKLRAGFEKQAKNFGIADRVRFVGRVERDELIRLYQTSSVLAFQSTSRAEAFGLVALEAQACGLPVVASDLPGVRTVVQNGETGLLIPVGDVTALHDALSLILTHDDKRKLFGIKAREHVLKRFTLDRHMDELIKIYQDLCV